MSNVTYTCPVCGKQLTVEAAAAIPVCHERKMERLPVCRTAPNPEMARNYDEDEPCDDGTNYDGKG